MTEEFVVEVDYHPKSGRLISERWKNRSGKFDRPGDMPAFINYCPEKGTPDYQRWHEPGGEQHREGDKPALIVSDPNSGVHLLETYSWLGDFHREGDKPAQIFRSEQGNILEEVYWKYGEKHRDPDCGPARIRYSPTNGRVLSTEYWVDGRQVPAPINKPTHDI